MKHPISFKIIFSLSKVLLFTFFIVHSLVATSEVNYSNDNYQGYMDVIKSTKEQALNFKKESFKNESIKKRKEFRGLIKILEDQKKKLASSKNLGFLKKRKIRIEIKKSLKLLDEKLREVDPSIEKIRKYKEEYSRKRSLGRRVFSCTYNALSSTLTFPFKILAKPLNSLGNRLIIPPKEFTNAHRDVKPISNPNMKGNIDVKFAVINPSDEHKKAILFLAGNGWGFDDSIGFSKDLVGNLENKIQVYTMAYLGQGSEVQGPRSEANHIEAVKLMIDRIMDDGFAPSDITILGHSIGGYLAGNALKDSKYDGVSALAVASPNSIGKVIFPKIPLDGFLNFISGWSSKPELGFSKFKDSSRFALYAEDDNFVTKPSTIANVLGINKSARIVGRSHNNCMDSNAMIYQETGHPNEISMLDKLKSIVNREGIKHLAEDIK